MQDFLTSLIATILLLSVVYFCIVFVLSLPDYEQRIRNRGTDLTVLVPTAPLVSVKELDQSLESQIEVPDAPAAPPYRLAQLAITTPAQLAITTPAQLAITTIQKVLLVPTVHGAPAAAPIVSVEQIDQNFHPQVGDRLLAQQFPLFFQLLLTLPRRPAPVALPLLPTISVEQADQNLDEQITALIAAENFPLECRTLLTSPRPAKAKNMGQSATTTITPKVAQETHKKLSVANLRTLCSTNEINWRNAHGKNKHLTQNEMVEALKRKGLTL